MPRHKPALYCAIALGILGSYFAVRAGQGLLSARLVAPTTIDLGNCEVESTKTAEIVIHNKGRAELEVSGLRSSCNCVFVMENADGLNDTSLRVPPGGKTSLKLSINVRGSAGEHRIHRIDFHSNDPNRPHHTIEVSYRLYARFVANPAGIELASILSGPKATARIDLQQFDLNSSAVPGEPIAQVNVSTVVQPMPIQESSAGTSRLGKVIASYLVTFDISKETSEIVGTITIPLRGIDAPVIIPVHGQVRRQVGLFPGEIDLPRASAQGPVYEAKCIAQHRGAMPMKCEVVDCPSHLEVIVPDNQVPKTNCLIMLRCRNPESIQETHRSMVRLKFVWVNGEQIDELSVVCHRP